jgi:hypothetical protein
VSGPVLGTVYWDAVTLAGAFVVGTVFATIALLRVLRAVLGIAERHGIPRRTDTDRRD